MPDTRFRTFPAGPGLSAYNAARRWLEAEGFAVGARFDRSPNPCGVARERLLPEVPRWDEIVMHDVLDGRIEPVHGRAYEGDGVKLTLRAELVPATEDPRDWA